MKDPQHELQCVKITLVQHQKLPEGLKKALPEEQDEIEDLKMGLLDMHNRLEYINTALVEQQEEKSSRM